MGIPSVHFTRPVFCMALFLLCGKANSGENVQSDGLSLSLSLPATTVPGNVPLKIVLCNRGGKAAQIRETGYTLDCRITLRTEKGRVCRFTRLGDMLFGEKENGAQSAIVRLQNGQVRHWNFNLAKAFEELTPGKYVLTLEANAKFCDSASKAFSDTRTLVVKDLQFQVQEARKKQ